MPSRFTAAVTARREHGSAVELAFEAPAGFAARPGQFMHVLCGEEEGRILRRPLSLYGLGAGRFSLLVKVAGAGTAWLAARRVGEAVDCMGPLGNGFDAEGHRPRLLVAGGAGIAPLRFLHGRLRAQGLETPVYWGVEKGGDYGDLPGLLAQGMDLHMASADGCMGFAGTVMDLLQDEYGGAWDGFAACGPRGMLVALAETIFSRGNGVFQVSLEERMACGIGACRGCAVPAAAPEGGYLAACADGPVFLGGDIDWERMRHSTWG